MLVATTVNIYLSKSIRFDILVLIWVLANVFTAALEIDHVIEPRATTTNSIQELTGAILFWRIWGF